MCIETLNEDKEMERLSREIESEMKPKVRDMLIFNENSDKDRIRFIHLLISLGISHYFETEIEEILNHAFGKLEVLISEEEDDLETVAIMFEVFRLYRHKMPCDVLNRFRGDDGKLNESIGEDVRGMLQLYEAAHLAAPSEDIMDQALSFTRKDLQAWTVLHLDDDGTSTRNLSKHVQNALETPRYQNIEILSAREYITFYNEEEDHDKTLLKFAKINFKFCQLHYTQELKTLTKWWEGLDLASKLPFIRDRIVESFSVALATYFEPRYSLGRIILTKLVIIVVALDDTCDAYGTFPEVKSLIDSLQRWEVDGIDEVSSSSYMRIMLQSLFENLDEIKREMKSRGRSSSVQYVIDEIKSLGRAYQEISKWARAGYVPSFEEYMEVGVLSAGMDDFAAYSFVALEDCDEKQTFDWFFSDPKIFQSLNNMFRITNDISTFEQEMKRGEVANGVNCYMKQHCVSKEEAVKDLSKMSRDHYKIMMEEFMASSKALPRQILMRCLNIGRQIYFFYQDHEDLYTNSQGNLKDLISSLFLPIP